MDRYVFSVIYKDCDSDDDTRKFYTAVNWLFTPDEADILFEGDFRLNFSKYIIRSQSILADNNYRFPENPPIHSQETNFTDKLETALASATFYSDLFAAQNYRKLMMQTFIGLDREEGLFESLFHTLDFRPPRMRKYLSFCIGALSASETYGVALVLMYNDILGPIVSSGSFNGAMVVNKLFFINDAFKIGSQIPSKAKLFANLDDSLRKQAISLFETSEDSTSYWNVIDAIATNDNSCFNGANLVKLLGVEGFKNNYQRNKFSTRQMVLMFKERDQIFDMPEVIEILRKHPGIAATAERELAEERAKQAALEAEQAALKAERKASKSKGLGWFLKNGKKKEENLSHANQQESSVSTNFVHDHLDNLDDTVEQDKLVDDATAYEKSVLDNFVDDSKSFEDYSKDKDETHYCDDIDDEEHSRKDLKNKDDKKNYKKDSDDNKKHHYKDKKDNKNRHHDDKKDQKKHDDKDGKHSAESNLKDKHNNLLKFFAYVGEVLADVWYEIVPFFAPVIILLFTVAFGICMYFVGVKILPLLPEFFARFVYGIQLALLIIVSLLCGCILKAKIESYMNREKRKKRSESKED